MRVASELQGTILKVFINRFGQAVCVECGSAYVEFADGKHCVWARVLADGYLHPQCVKIWDSEEFANSSAGEINYPTKALEVLSAM